MAPIYSGLFFVPNNIDERVVKILLFLRICCAEMDKWYFFTYVTIALPL
jgi:hypothetical protein